VRSAEVGAVIGVVMVLLLRGSATWHGEFDQLVELCSSVTRVEHVIESFIAQACR
jgi:hypothetical protein